jgi:hypothetical protein
VRKAGAIVGVLIAAVLLCAAGPYTAKLSPPDLRRIHTVAVISALGSTFLFQHVRNTQLEWLGPPDSHYLEISDWALDQKIARDVTAALEKRFVVKPIAFESANFSSWNERLLRQASLDLNGDPAIDAYVLVLRDWHYDLIGHSVHELCGLGLYRRDGNAARYGVFAGYRVVVVDALTGDIIASREALTRDGKLPWAPVDPALWPKTQNDLTPAQRATLVADETGLLDATLVQTLQQLNLVR